MYTQGKLMRSSTNYLCKIPTGVNFNVLKKKVLMKLSDIQDRDMKMKNSFIFKMFLIFFIIESTAFPLQHEQEVKTILKNFIQKNSTYKKNKEIAYFDSFSQHQAPQATVVMCSDSRVQTDAFEVDATNQLFIIRNIGNQLCTAEGSIEYGVLHLHTPLLIFIGHSACGAIKAAQSDYSRESDPIKEELDKLDVKNIKNTDLAIVENIHHQVENAMQVFESQIAQKTLTIVGALYDFRNDFKQGHGALIILNINGQKDVAALESSNLLKGIKEAKIGVKTP
jgi:carbonic anhydrase